MLIYHNFFVFIKLDKIILTTILIFLSLVPMLSAASEIKENTSPDMAVVPYALIDTGDNLGYALIVEKKTQKMFLYDHHQNLIKTYNVTTGKRRGDKQVSGDKKTPEGIYFFSYIKEKKYLAPKYGIMALTMNYPNLYDDYEEKRGNGIWLHATDQPQRTFKQYDTLGCVVMVNRDMYEISRFISLEKTPIIIEEEIRYDSKENIHRVAVEIEGFVESWKQSWEGKDIDRYIETYSERFFRDGMDREEWKAYKKELNERYKTISVTISNLNIFAHRDYVVASFLQNYHSDSFNSTGMKRLYIVRENNTWKVLGEEWKRLRDESPFRVAQNYRYLIQDLKEAPVVKREDWFLSKNPSHYALQLIGVSSEHKIIRFIEKYGLSEDDVGYYRTTFNGKDWYVLIYGDFPNFSAAKGASNNLPDYLKIPSPWVRSVKSIQLAISQFSNVGQ